MFWKMLAHFKLQFSFFLKFPLTRFWNISAMLKEGDTRAQEDMLKNQCKAINGGASRNIYKLVWGCWCIYFQPTFCYRIQACQCLSDCCCVAENCVYMLIGSKEHAAFALQKVLCILYAYTDLKLVPSPFPINRFQFLVWNECGYTHKHTHTFTQSSVCFITVSLFHSVPNQSMEILYIDIMFWLGSSLKLTFSRLLKRRKIGFFCYIAPFYSRHISLPPNYSE